MKALTFHQPWASLVAVGAKRIETRSWATKYRGPLAIHAGARQVHHGEFFMLAREALRAGLIDQAHEAMFRELAVPFSAVVATCRLVDVVPIVDLWPSPTRTPGKLPCLYAGKRYPLTVWRSADSEVPGEHVESERPFGDFSPGRYAWLVDDVAPTTERCPWCGLDLCKYPGRVATSATVWTDPSGAAGESMEHEPCPVCEGAGKCDPMPARGRQQLWEWKPTDGR